MYLQEFPNIKWIRENALQNFANRKDYFGNLLPSEGWPNVILNVKSSMVERDNIKGPFSLFYNLEGKSLVGVENNWYLASNDFYCTSNNDQLFNLHLPKGESKTTFNIHFGKVLYEDVVQQLFHSTDWLLDNFGNSLVPTFEILPKTEFIGEELRIKLLLSSKYYEYNKDSYCLDKEYELTASILRQLLQDKEKLLNRKGQISAQKTSTKKELFRRINIGLDYIHSNELNSVSLDSVCKNCGLSKFHFIRVFKEVYGTSPNSYISELKAKKAQRLLIETEKTISDISLELGFSEVSAFTRFFKRMRGKAPSSFK